MTWRSKLSLAFAMVTGVQAWAIGEENYLETFHLKVAPFFATGVPGELPGQEGVRIAYRRFINPAAHASVLVLPGYSENQEKYAEVAYDLYQAGYSVFILDPRGQGGSGHLLADLQKAHIDEFENFIKDLKAFYRTAFALRTGTQKPEPRFLLAHSMAGLIAARYLEEYPSDFDAAVLSAPMFGLTINAYLRAPLQILLSGLSWLGWDQFYMRGPRDPREFTFTTNTVTHSSARYETLQIEPTRRAPEVNVWGLTARWLVQAFRGMKLTLNDARQATTPILLFQAGEDSFVLPEPQEQFCTQAQNCRLEKFSEARHEILMESDSTRSPAFAQLLNFFATTKVNK